MRAARLRPFLLPALASLVLVGCASVPPKTHPEARAEYLRTNDPLEPTNRVFYRVNNALDAAVLRPVAVAYKDAVPAPARQGVHNVLTNLSAPMALADAMLAGRPHRAGTTMMRFLINTTLGGLGLFDVASHLGYPEHDTDFGETMAVWGVPEGPFLYLPVFGPSDPRDALGEGVDIAADPLGWFGQGTAVTALRWSRTGISAIDARSRVIGELSAVKRTALDPYATFRSLYRQHRHAQIAELRAAPAGTVPAWFPAPQAAPAPRPATPPPPLPRLHVRRPPTAARP